jgi:hypothetical protein
MPIDPQVEQLLTELSQTSRELGLDDTQSLDACIRKTKMMIRKYVGPDSHYMTDVAEISFDPGIYPASDEYTRKCWNDGCASLANLIDTLIDQLSLESFLDFVPAEPKPAGKAPNPAQTIYMSGDNSRLNINSEDMSTNIVSYDMRVFRQLRETVEKHVENADEKARIETAIKGMEDSVGSETFVQRYQDFIASAANHMTLLSPFIPALTAMFG